MLKLILIYGVFFVFLFVNIIAFFSSPIHDYSQYVDIWGNFLKTGHPYFLMDGSFNGNAYGPLFILFAYMWKIHQMFPKIFFLMCWFTLGIFLLLYAHRRRLNERQMLIIFIIIFLNPFFYIHYVLFGINEIVMSFFIVFTIYYLEKKKDGFAGLLLALGVLIKFLPIMLFPLFLNTKHKIRLKFLFSFVITSILGFGISYFVWGKEIAAPIQFALNRGSGPLSIFYFLKGSFSPLRFFIMKPNLDWLSTPCLLFSLGVLFIIQIKKNFSPTTLIIHALFLILLFYRVNNAHFHTTLLMMFIFWYIKNNKILEQKKFKRYFLILYMIWISTLPILYVAMNNFYGRWVLMRDIIGLPTTVLLVVAWLEFTFIERAIAGEYYLTKKESFLSVRRSNK